MEDRRENQLEMSSLPVPPNLHLSLVGKMHVIHQITCYPWLCSLS